MALALHHSRATGTAKLVLLGIANHDGDGGSFPSALTLAKYANLSGWDAEPTDDSKEARQEAKRQRDNARRAAVRATRKLEALGEIEVLTNGGDLAKPVHERTNLYKINLSCPADCDHSTRHRKRVRKPVDNSPNEGVTPQPGGDSPTGRGVTPQPDEPPNKHPLGNSLNSSGESRANDRVSNLEMTEDGYADWNPSDKIAEARRKMIEAKDQPAPVKRYTAPPAPHIPRFDPGSVPPPPEPVSPEQQALNEVANTFACSEGFGTGKGSRHWIPATETGCCRCGKEAQDILNQANQLTENEQ